jgi:putative Ca2+/H+ antiporter (TMEM165/GDT1 family)
MSRLSTLRSQLTALQQARWFVRAAVAVSALVIAALWALVGILVLDLSFELPPPQRLVVIAIAIGFVVWAGIRYTWPMLQVHETVEDMALLVERQQKIDSDLIAALQFEKPGAEEWG